MKKRKLILNHIKRIGKPIGEHEFHMMFKIATESSMSDLYEFKPRLWEEINEKYQTGLGHLPYSSRLHELIESLVKKDYLSRGSEEPILIFENKQLKLI